jgi:L-ascorbate metabolism protein UlaG (beta-lactamase superfamily)
MQIIWLGHGTFEFKLPSGEVIVRDPWADGNPKYLPDHKFSRLDTF